MLVLTREVEEGIQIGPDIFIKVVSIYGGKVRLGIHAPPNITIDREEVALAKAKDRAEHEQEQQS